MQPTTTHPTQVYTMSARDRYLNAIQSSGSSTSSSKRKYEVRSTESGQESSAQQPFLRVTHVPSPGHHPTHETRPQLMNMKQQWDPKRDIPVGKVSNHGKNSSPADYYSNSAPQLKNLKEQWDVSRDIPKGVVGKHKDAHSPPADKYRPARQLSQQQVQLKQRQQLRGSIKDPTQGGAGKVNPTKTRQELMAAILALPPPPPPPPRPSPSPSQLQASPHNSNIKQTQKGHVVHDEQVDAYEEKSLSYDDDDSNQNDPSHHYAESSIGIAPLALLHDDDENNGETLHYIQDPTPNQRLRGHHFLHQTNEESYVNETRSSLQQERLKIQPNHSTYTPVPPPPPPPPPPLRHTYPSISKNETIVKTSMQPSSAYDEIEDNKKRLLLTPPTLTLTHETDDRTMGENVIIHENKFNHHTDDTNRPSGGETLDNYNDHDAQETVKESVAERRRKRYRALTQGSGNGYANHVTQSSPVPLTLKNLDRDNNNTIVAFSATQRTDTRFSESGLGSSSSLTPILTLDGYSDDEDSVDNQNTLFGKSMPKPLLNMKNKIRKLPQAGNKPQSIQQKLSSKLSRSTNDKYAGKHSAEVIVDRSRLPVHMQNVNKAYSPPPESLSTTSSPQSTQKSNTSEGNTENSSMNKNYPRRQHRLESPTKQVYPYGGAGIDLYNMRDDDNDDIKPDDEEEELVSNDSSVSEMTNPTFFIQQESVLITRSTNMTSIGLNSQTIDRGPTPSESESSIDISESATPLIGGGTKIASHSSHEGGGRRSNKGREDSDEDTEQSEDAFIFSPSDWQGINKLNSKGLPSEGLNSYQVSRYDSNMIPMNNKSGTHSLDTPSYDDPPLDCVDEDTESESSNAGHSMRSSPDEKTAFDNLEDDSIHLSVAEIRSARRHSKIDYDVKVKAVEFSSHGNYQSPITDYRDKAYNRYEKPISDYALSGKNRALERNVDRMNIAEMGASGGIKHASSAPMPLSKHRKRESIVSVLSTKKSYGDSTPFDEPYLENDLPKARYGKPNSSRPFDEGDFDVEICAINQKQQMAYAGRSLTHHTSSPRQVINDRSVTPVMSSRQSVVYNHDGNELLLDRGIPYSKETDLSSPNIAIVRRSRYGQHSDKVLYASITIQSYCRRWIAELYRYRCIYAVTKIQSMFRGWLSRDILADEHYCATIIQSHFRAYLSTMYVYETLYNVTIIQSLFRRKLAMEEAKRRRTAISVIQKHVRTFRHEHTLQKSATKIQASWRGFITHLIYQFTLVDVIIVQSVFRRWQALKRYSIMRHHKAAMTIQKVWRGKKAQVAFVNDLVSIILSQSIIRRRVAINRYQKLRQENIEMISSVETYSHVVETASMNAAARIIQRSWRCYWEKILSGEQLRLCENAALVIQSFWRRSQHHQNFKKMINSIRRIQQSIKLHPKKREEQIENLEYLSLLDVITTGNADSDLINIEQHSISYDSKLYELKDESFATDTLDDIKRKRLCGHALISESVDDAQLVHGENDLSSDGVMSNLLIKPDDHLSLHQPEELTVGSKNIDEFSSPSESLVVLEPEDQTIVAELLDRNMMENQLEPLSTRNENFAVDHHLIMDDSCLTSNEESVHSSYPLVHSSTPDDRQPEVECLIASLSFDDEDEEEEADEMNNNVIGSKNIDEYSSPSESLVVFEPEDQTIVAELLDRNMMENQLEPLSTRNENFAVDHHLIMDDSCLTSNEESVHSSYPLVDSSTPDDRQPEVECLIASLSFDDEDEEEEADEMNNNVVGSKNIDEYSSPSESLVVLEPEDQTIVAELLDRNMMENQLEPLSTRNENFAVDHHLIMDDSCLTSNEESVHSSYPLVDSSTPDDFQPEVECLIASLSFDDEDEEEEADEMNNNVVGSKNIDEYSSPSESLVVLEPEDQTIVAELLDRNMMENQLEPLSTRNENFAVDHHLIMDDSCLTSNEESVHSSYPLVHSSTPDDRQPEVECLIASLSFDDEDEEEEADEMNNNVIGSKNIDEFSSPSELSVVLEPVDQTIVAELLDRNMMENQLEPLSTRNENFAVDHHLIMDDSCLTSNEESVHSSYPLVDSSTPDDLQPEVECLIASLSFDDEDEEEEADEMNNNVVGSKNIDEFSSPSESLVVLEPEDQTIVAELLDRNMMENQLEPLSTRNENFAVDHHLIMDDSCLTSNEESVHSSYPLVHSSTPDDRQSEANSRIVDVPTCLESIQKEEVFKSSLSLDDEAEESNNYIIHRTESEELSYDDIDALDNEDCLSYDEACDFHMLNSVKIQECFNENICDENMVGITITESSYDFHDNIEANILGWRYEGKTQELDMDSDDHCFNDSPTPAMDKDCFFLESTYESSFKYEMEAKSAGIFLDEKSVKDVRKLSTSPCENTETMTSVFIPTQEGEMIPCKNPSLVILPLTCTEDRILESTMIIEDTNNSSESNLEAQLNDLCIDEGIGKLEMETNGIKIAVSPSAFYVSPEKNLCGPSDGWNNMIGSSSSSLY